MPRIFYLIILCFSLSLNVYLIYFINIDQLKNILPNKHSATEKNIITTAKVNNTTVNKAAIENEQVIKNKTDNVTEISLAIKQLIQAKNFSEASNLLYQLSRINEAETKVIEDIWYESAEQLLRNKAWQNAENAITNFLSYAFDDIRFLYLEVQLLVDKKQIFAAIKKAYDMQYYIFEPFEQTQSIVLARKLVQDEAEQLISINAWDKLAELALFAQNLDPQQHYLQWLHSQALFNLGQYENTLNTLTPLLTVANYSVAAKQLYQQAQRALLKPSQIPLEKRGEHYFVNGLINQRLNVKLMLDTGASISLLSPESYQLLTRQGNVKFIQDIQLNTAGGQITSAIYQVSEFSLQGFSLTNFTFAVSPYIEQESDGLLGMNYLKHFDFYLDQQNQSLVLETKIMP